MNAAAPANAGGDTELLSEVLRIQTKVFFLDLKENQRGRYLKIAEKGRYRPKSSVVVPLSGLPQFIVMFDYYMAEAAAGRVGQPRDVIVESKVFNFSTGDNERGRFLRIFESGGGYPAGGSSLMIPAGWGNNYLLSFRECLEKVAAFLAKDGHDFDLHRIAAASALPGPSHGQDAVQLDSSKEGGPVLSVGTKHFFFDLRQNERGSYLKIKEVSGNLKNLLVVPLPAVAKFQEAINLALHAQPKLDQSEAAGLPAAIGPGSSSAPAPPPPALPRGHMM
mmetsp:Transcript_13621/g.29181  ORF Transcript_13621/g.29181 Transcript_13621/m.29181 type:complete len:278 (-) Transcript_13621:2477-3310(-)|eukprot:CAMPEP_0202889988 /NCGR_PEP_ID=MMETSP1392-20130828/513_1 /ASSEMBLY_ACC=CAM_ASM_000868 /TAXON_ID=225041 /ORGANISM="Chlamydomonas chlamydogama, Strain SAG 11-48b" /LENGTH=277 /DNA_ID=CAMNT_0049573455 /DNA_START=148 /DNA_END=981 /DNA_ORIENTATION=+